LHLKQQPNASFQHEHIHTPADLTVRLPTLLPAFLFLQTATLM
jgi:hypothetical protein